MTDKEKIRAEIERRYKECKGATPATEYQELLDLIDSMQKEPVSEDLEKELSRLLKDCEIDSEYIHQDFLHVVANHFADWQKKQMKKNIIRGIAHLLVDRSPYEIVIKAEEIQNLKHGTLVKFIIIK